MFTNSVLFKAGGISFTLANCFFIGAAVLGVVAALLFAILFKRTHGVVKRMSPDEAARVQVYGMGQAVDFNPDPVAYVKTVGATGRSAELSFDIDSLRNAHRSGDLATFWLAPLMFTSWCLAAWLLFMGCMIALPVPSGFQIMLTAVVLLIVLVPWFMVWAAVNTNIDLGKAKPAAPVTAGRPSPGSPGAHELPSTGSRR